MKDIARKGIPFTKRGLLYTAKLLLSEGHGKVTSTFNLYNGPGCRWFESFMSRHKGISVR